MILYHPLPIEVKEKTIERYKDRFVHVKNKIGLWLTYSFKDGHYFYIFSFCAERKKIDFKVAVEITEHLSKTEGVEYHFIDDFGEEKPNIKDFDMEDHINCPTVKFDEYHQPHTKKLTK